MKLKTLPILLLFILSMFSVVSCFDIGAESDSTTFQLTSFFDLRERETYLQLTNTQIAPTNVHVQIFNVDQDCNENDFFDDYTGNDTHIYNLRDIQTNDGNPSGVVLPANAYGMVVITITTQGTPLIGNLRILDNAGYEYRTNMVGTQVISADLEDTGQITLNYNNQGGVSLSDVVGFSFDQVDESEVVAADIVNVNFVLDVDILDLNENVFSCRNVIFACTDQDNPLREALLEEVGNANVASFEYGINDVITHSRGGELLCPGNNIEEGIIRLSIFGQENNTDVSGIFIGLNNNNGRGSIDSMWFQNRSDEPT